MLTRIISGIALSPIVILMTYLGGMAFSILLLAVFLLATYEWIKMVMPKNSFAWYFFGLFYIFIPCMSLFYLRHLPDGLKITFWLLFAVWATDIAGYFFGKAIGGPKIAPSISPNKTWAGLIAGMICASIVGHIFSHLLLNKSHIIVVSAMIAIVAQAGDFFESKVKRIFNIKDSGTLIPGHGGILDRIDGLLTASIFIAALEIMNG